MGVYSDKDGPRFQPPDRVASQIIRVRLTVAEREAVFMIASEEETTMSDIVREAIVLYSTLRD